MIVISALGTDVKTKGVDQTDRVSITPYKFLISIVDLGAHQVLKQRHLEGILRCVVLGVFLLSAVLT